MRQMCEMCDTRKMCEMCEMCVCIQFIGLTAGTFFYWKATIGKQ